MTKPVEPILIDTTPEPAATARPVPAIVVPEDPNRCPKCRGLLANLGGRPYCTLCSYCGGC